MLKSSNALQLSYSDDSQYEGNIIVTTKTPKGEWKQIAFFQRSKVAEMIQTLEFRQNFDYYITANSVIANRRNADSLLGLNNIVIDIDCHNNFLPVDIKELAIDTFIDKLNGSGLPLPTVLHKTGRGVQLWYHIEQIAATIKWKYDITAKRIIKAVKSIIEENPTACGCLNVDEAATLNAAGNFRLFETYNTKTGTRGEVQTYETSYTINLLCELFSDYAEEEQPPKKRPIVFHDADFQPLLKGRINVLEQFAQEQTEPGNRDSVLWLYYNTCVQMYTPNKAAQLLREFNNTLFQPLTQRELKAIVKCIDEKGYYKLKNDRFCLHLGITIDYYNKYKNINTVRRDAERTEKRKNKEERTKFIIDMLKNGHAIKEVSELAGVSEKTVSRLSAELPKDNKPWEELNMSKATYYRKKKQGLL